MKDTGETRTRLCTIAPACALLIALGVPLQALSYEISTHARITYAAFLQSQMSSSTVLDSLGLFGGATTDLGTLYLDMSGASTNPPIILTKSNWEESNRRMPFAVNSTLPREVPGWLLRGAIREDDGGLILGFTNPHDDPAGTLNRFCNHFYDPVNNRKLDAPILCGFDDKTSSPIWALGVPETTGIPGGILAPTPMFPADPNRRNHYTLLDAREAEWRALTLKQHKNSSGALLLDGNGSLLDLPAPIIWDGYFLPPTFSGDPVKAHEEQRKAYWATMFRALGDVLHLNQDMGQPQHTRPEIHPFNEGGIYEAYVDTRARANDGALFFFGTVSPPAATALAPPSLNFTAEYVPTFTNYSDYWTTAPSSVANGFGLADYSNRGFFTVQHGFGERSYVLPSNSIGDYTLGDTHDLRGLTWRYLDSVVPDRIVGNSRVIHMAKESVWNVAQTAAGITPSDPAYSLDLSIYDDHVELLMPRAVGYSVGLLNYFARGKMAINLPDAGFYAIVDHSKFAPPNQPTDVLNGFKGFSKIKLRLQNVTADITPAGGGPAVPQNMPAGTLVAVLKFHRNTCYDDLLKNLPTSSGAAFGCRSAYEEIVVSKPLSRDVPPTSGAEPNGPELTFDFPKELPINAWDVVLQVVYRGKLGTEDDAVVVATKDISEPTFATYLNTTDWVVLNNTYYKPEQITQTQFATQVNPACRTGSPGAYQVYQGCYNIPAAFKFTAGNSDVAIEANGQQAVPTRRLARFALLADLDANSNPRLFWSPADITCYIFLDNPDLISPQRAQNSSQNGWTYGMPIDVRGFKVWDGIACYSDIGVSPSDPESLDLTQLDEVTDSEKAPTSITIENWDTAVP